LGLARQAAKTPQIAEPNRFKLLPKYYWSGAGQEIKHPQFDPK